LDDHNISLLPKRFLHISFPVADPYSFLGSLELEASHMPEDKTYVSEPPFPPIHPPASLINDDRINIFDCFE
jgi:hypothetical protein